MLARRPWSTQKELCRVCRNLLHIVKQRSRICKGFHYTDETVERSMLNAPDRVMGDEHEIILHVGPPTWKALVNLGHCCQTSASGNSRSIALMSTEVLTVLLLPRHCPPTNIKLQVSSRDQRMVVGDGVSSAPRLPG